MKLNKISLQNIRSYEHQEIVFPEGATLLSGDIGSGKTSVLLAIEFALFGLQPGQRGSGLLANGQETGSVKLECEIDGKHVTIERTLKKGSKSISQEKSLLTIDGITEEFSVTELKSRVLDLLNYPEEFVKKTNLLYRFTVYAPQEEMKQIILEDPESRLNILRYIFGIDKYKRIRENSLLIAARLREQLRALQLEVRDIDSERSRIEDDRNRVTVLNEKQAEKNREIESKIKQRKEIEIKLKEFSDKMGERVRYEKEIEKAGIMISNKVETLQSTESEIKLLEQRSLVKHNIDADNVIVIHKEWELTNKNIEEMIKKKIEANAILATLADKKRESLERKKRIFELQICPTCLQDVSMTYKHNILNEHENTISKIDNDISALVDKDRDLDIKIIDLRKKSNLLLEKKKDVEKLVSLNEEIERAKREIEPRLKIRESLKKDIDFLNEHLLSLRESIVSFSKFETQQRIAESELKQAFYLEKKAEIELAEIRKEIELAEKEIVRLEAGLSKKEKTREKLAYMVAFEQWLSNDFISIVSFTERNIMLKVREEFSKLFNKWFSLLTTDAFYVQLDENFTPIIVQGDYELDYGFLSGGERTAVALAYRLALNQVINSVLSTIKTKDLLILDEPTDGFSEQQLDKVRDILHELDVKQLIIVSHERQIESFVDTIIRLKKENAKTVYTH
jgi:exonuclease SbcC